MNFIEYVTSNFNIMSASQVTTLGLAYDYGTLKIVTKSRNHYSNTKNNCLLFRLCDALSKVCVCY